MEGEAQEEVVKDVRREGWCGTDHARRQQRLNEKKGRSSDEEERFLQDLKDLSKNKLSLVSFLSRAQPQETAHRIGVKVGASCSHHHNTNGLSDSTGAAQIRHSGWSRLQSRKADCSLRQNSLQTTDAYRSRTS